MARLACVILIVAACTPPEPPPSATVPLMDFEGRFFDAPFPTPGRLRPDGTLDVDDFPARGNTLAARIVEQLSKQGEGYGRSSAVWFRFSGGIDPASLPESPAASASFDSSVYLVALASGTFIPLETRFKAAQETYSPTNLLVALPFQGHVLEPATDYAAVVTRKLRGDDGLSVARAAFLDSQSGAGATLRAELPRVRTLLESHGRAWSEVAAVTVFKTGSHLPRLKALAAAMRARPAALARPVAMLQDYPTYAVLEGALEVPLFQRGAKPYTTDGELVFGADGVPVEQSTEVIRFALAVPKRAMPPGGYPILFHVPGSGGDYLAVVGGLAKQLAARGIAAFGTEPNLTGPRGPGGVDASQIFYNVFNPVALRDNHRQAAAEYELFANLVKGLSVDGALVPEAQAAAIRFDAARFFLHGHSTGSVVGASVLVEGTYPVAALSGAGGSWLYNLVLKQTPNVAELTKSLLGYVDGDTVDVFDPVLTLVATMWDPIEPMNQSKAWSGSVLLIEGINDTYYLPRMVNSLAMAARADVAAPAIDPDTEGELQQVGAGARATPFSANRGARTVGLVQHRAGPGHDGHYVVWDVAQAQYQYGCFFASAVAGATPVVVPPASDAFAPCP